jgi:hypothetical protein
VTAHRPTTTITVRATRNLMTSSIEVEVTAEGQNYAETNALIAAAGKAGAKLYTDLGPERDDDTAADGGTSADTATLTTHGGGK